LGYAYDLNCVGLWMVVDEVDNIVLDTEEYDSSAWRNVRREDGKCAFEIRKEK
jgi:hypothetical protein